MSAPYAHILCCFEDSEPSREALAEARRLRALGPGRLTVVHVADESRWWGITAGYAIAIPEPIQDTERMWRWLRAEVADEDAVVEILSGYPPAVVCDWAEDNRPDVIVAAAHRGLVDRMLLGSFAGYLVHHAPCPVLLIRPGSTAPGERNLGDVAGAAAGA